MIKHLFKLSVFLVILTGCAPWDYSEIEFLIVNTASVSRLSSNTVQVSGSIELPNPNIIEELEEFGFCWSFEGQEPEMDSEDQCRNLSDYASSIDFRDTLADLPFDKVLIVRAYAVLDGKPFYGEVKSIRTDLIGLTVDSVTSVTFETAIVEGTILGLGQGVTSVCEYGHCWLQGNDTPGKNNNDGKTNLEGRSEDGFFISELNGLKASTDYSIVSYATYKCGLEGERTFYSPVKHFRIEDIWTSHSPTPNRGRYGGVSFTLGGHGYIGMGFDLTIHDFNIFDFTPVNDFLEYNFEQNEWRKLDNYSWACRMHAVSFVLGDIAYVGTGYRPVAPHADDAPGTQYFNDFWFFDGQVWDSLTVSFPGQPRYGAVAFTVANIAYVGLGRDESGKSLFDFWSFDGGAWEELTTSFPGQPRYGAVTFTIGDTAYVGLGEGEGGQKLNDFYRFSLSAFPVWNQLDDFPGEARKGAIGLALLEKGYIAAGSNSGDFALSDFWEFNPGDSSMPWRPRACLLSVGQIRTYGLSVGYQGRGFFGTGLSVRGALGVESALSDWHEYFPEE